MMSAVVVKSTNQKKTSTAESADTRKVIHEISDTAHTA